MLKKFQHDRDILNVSGFDYGLWYLHCPIYHLISFGKIYYDEKIKVVRISSF